MNSRAKPSRTRPPKRRPAFAWLGFVLSVALIASTALAGTRYFYCSIMGEAQFTSCCAHAEHEGATPADELTAAGCCEGRQFDGLPSGQISTPPAVAAAPLVATLSNAHVAVPPALPVRWSPARSGSDPPLPSEARSRLMVFLI